MPARICRVCCRVPEGGLQAGSEAVAVALRAHQFHHEPVVVVAVVAVERRIDRRQEITGSCRRATRPHFPEAVAVEVDEGPATPYRRLRTLFREGAVPAIGEKAPSDLQIKVSVIVRIQHVGRRVGRRIDGRDLVDDVQSRLFGDFGELSVTLIGEQKPG